MPKAGWGARLAATLLVVVLGSAVGRVQEPQRVLSLAADTIDELRQWGSLRADYTIGEDLTDLGVSRSLQNPASLAIDGVTGVQYPDHFSRRISFTLVVLPNGSLSLSPLALVAGTPVVLSDDDDGGVHWNSTILSHAFYLAIEGGQNRTSGRTVQGVGTANRVQIEQVFFRAVRDMLPSTVTFGQVGAILRQASVDVHGASSAATTAIGQALTAVGL